MPRVSLVFLSALTAGASYAEAAVLEANPTSLTRVVAQAKPGDVVRLSPGAYGRVVIANESFHPSLVIDARGATFEQMELRRSKGIEIRGGKFTLPPPMPHPRTQDLVFGYGLRMDAVDGIKISDATFVGPGALDEGPNAPFGAGYGLFVVRSANVVVESSAFQGFKSGVVLSKVDGFRVANNRFRAMRSDGMQAGESRRGVIEGNHCSDTRQLPADHPDCIQLWSRPTSPPTSDVLIRRNKAEGPSQGVFLGNHVRDGVDDGGFDRIVIEENDLFVGYPNAINITSGRNSVVRNNRVATIEGAKWRASINLVGGTSERCGNTVAPGAGKPGIKDRPCD